MLTPTLVFAAETGPAVPKAPAMIVFAKPAAAIADNAQQRREGHGGDRGNFRGHRGGRGSTNGGNGDGFRARNGNSRSENRIEQRTDLRQDIRRGDRNRDGAVDRRFDRNNNGVVDRRFDRNNNGVVDRRIDRDRDGRIDRREARPGGSVATHRFEERREDRRDDRSGYRDSNRDEYRRDYRRNDRQDYRRDGYDRSNRREWNSGWRSDRRYDWYSHRSRYRDYYRPGRYYAPYRDYGYRRYSVGLFLGSGFYGSRYWITNPGNYRLPAAYGSYRWVRYYNDVLLVDIYDGRVVDVIYNFFY
jgi:hypothetical protein